MLSLRLRVLSFGWISFCLRALLALWLQWQWQDKFFPHRNSCDDSYTINGVSVTFRTTAKGTASLAGAKIPVTSWPVVSELSESLGWETKRRPGAFFLVTQDHHNLDVCELTRISVVICISIRFLATVLLFPYSLLYPVKPTILFHPLVQLFHFELEYRGHVLFKHRPERHKEERTESHFFFFLLYHQIKYNFRGLQSHIF